LVRRNFHMGRRRIPIQEGLFTWPSDQPALIGSRCEACGEVTFPPQRSCPACCREQIENVELPRRGRLWTWTIQGFPPKSPPYGKVVTRETFVPYGVGYVELPGAVRVESRLTVNDPEKLAIGMEMELAVEPFTRDAEGNEVMMFCFRPTKEV
jgi:uncharacterized OB-fold protein